MSTYAELVKPQVSSASFGDRLTRWLSQHRGYRVEFDAVDYGENGGSFFTTSITYHGSHVLTRTSRASLAEALTLVFSAFDAQFDA